MKDESVVDNDVVNKSIIRMLSETEIKRYYKNAQNLYKTMQNNFLVKLQEKINNNYIQDMTAEKAIQDLIDTYNSDEMRQKSFEIASKLTKDSWFQQQLSNLAKLGANTAVDPNKNFTNQSTAAKKVINDQLKKFKETNETELRNTIYRVLQKEIPGLKKEEQAYSIDDLESWSLSIFKNQIMRSLGKSEKKISIRQAPGAGYVLEILAYNNFYKMFEKAGLTNVVLHTGPIKVERDILGRSKQVESLYDLFVSLGEPIGSLQGEFTSSVDINTGFLKTQHHYGIQSKLWELPVKSPLENALPSKYRITSNADLYHSFTSQVYSLDAKYVDSLGVSFLAPHTTAIFGSNIMYATGSSLNWTSDFIAAFVKQNYYLAFYRDYNGKQTSSIAWVYKAYQNATS